MIRYPHGSFNPRSLFKLRGSVFRKSVWPSLFCGIMGAVFKFMELRNAFGLAFLFQDVLTNNSAYSSVSVLIGFLVIFRTQQSYNRFWDGCKFIKVMQAEWFMTASNLFAFCRHNTDQGMALERKEFQDVLVRLVSLLHAVACAQLHGKESDAILELMREADAMGLDTVTNKTIQDEECKVELLVQYLQTLTVDAQVSGVLTVAPPILSRVFQNLSNGLSGFYSAYRIAEVPFPFPYMQATELLLLGFCIITPVAMCSFTAVPAWSGFFCFVISLILLSLNQIAVELEDPYGTDVNDLNLTELQQDMNKRLQMLHLHAHHATPTLDLGRPSKTCSFTSDTFTHFSDENNDSCPKRGKMLTLFSSKVVQRAFDSMFSFLRPSSRSHSSELAVHAADAAAKGEGDGEGKEEDEKVGDLEGGSDDRSSAEAGDTNSGGGGGGGRKHPRRSAMSAPSGMTPGAQAVAPQGVTADAVPDEICLIPSGHGPGRNRRSPRGAAEATSSGWQEHTSSDGAGWENSGCEEDAEADRVAFDGLPQMVVGHAHPVGVDATTTSRRHHLTSPSQLATPASYSDRHAHLVTSIDCGAALRPGSCAEPPTTATPGRVGHSILGSGLSPAAFDSPPLGALAAH